MMAAATATIQRLGMEGIATAQALTTKEWKPEDAHFDLVIGWWTLSYLDVQGRKSYLRKISSCLKSGGFLVISEPVAEAPELTHAFGQEMTVRKHDFYETLLASHGFLLQRSQVHKQAVRSPEDDLELYDTLVAVYQKP